MKIKDLNVDEKVVQDFGREWKAFNHSDLPDSDLKEAFEQYFHIFPFEKIGAQSIGFDMGCGSGRWAKFIAPKVGILNCIDASDLALQQAKSNLSKFSNCEFECASVSSSTLKSHSQDFGYSLGVLHHIPDTFEGIKSCSKLLKSGAPFLLYLYYRFDNQPSWFKAIWKVSDLLRQVICNLPFPLKYFASQIIAFGVYWPMARLSLLAEMIGINISSFPLSDYRNKPMYFLRTDALDRFGTRLEQRFTKKEIEKMLLSAGFKDIKFSSRTPYWVAIATKA
jgi:ubiquinone/menaquinone biosynthesis C-methylase UbiE